MPTAAPPCEGAPATATGSVACHICMALLLCKLAGARAHALTRPAAGLWEALCGASQQDAECWLLRFHYGRDKSTGGRPRVTRQQLGCEGADCRLAFELAQITHTRSLTACQCKEKTRCALLEADESYAYLYSNIYLQLIDILTFAPEQKRAQSCHRQQDKSTAQACRDIKQ